MVAEGVDDYRNSINYNPRLNNNCQVYPTKLQPPLNESGSHPTKNETRLSTFLSAWYSDKVYTGTILMRKFTINF